MKNLITFQKFSTNESTVNHFKGQLTLGAVTFELKVPFGADDYEIVFPAKPEITIATGIPKNNYEKAEQLFKLLKSNLPTNLNVDELYKRVDKMADEFFTKNKAEL